MSILLPHAAILIPRVVEERIAVRYPFYAGSPIDA